MSRPPRALARVAGALSLFDQQPFEIDGFKFFARGVEAIARPSSTQWQAAYAFAEAAQQASDWWLGDLLSYAESRQDWQTRIDQLQSSTGLAHQTLLNRTNVARSIAPTERAIAPTFSHAAAVAALEPDAQREFLEQARDDGWSVSELRAAVTASSRTVVARGQALQAALEKRIALLTKQHAVLGRLLADRRPTKMLQTSIPAVVDELVAILRGQRD